MINIRKGIFETNSSSMHSLVLLKQSDEENYFKASYLDPDGRLYIYDHELNFGRSPFEVLYTFVDKLRYAIAYFGEKRFSELEDLAKKYIPSCQGIKLYPRDDYGYVDHQSWGLLDKVDLEEWLTNPNEIVIIDGDEYCVFESLVEAGLINQENIVRRKKLYD